MFLCFVHLLFHCSRIYFNLFLRTFECFVLGERKFFFNWKQVRRFCFCFWFWMMDWFRKFFDILNYSVHFVRFLEILFFLDEIFGDFCWWRYFLKRSLWDCMLKNTIFALINNLRFPVRCQISVDHHWGHNTNNFYHKYI